MCNFNHNSRIKGDYNNVKNIKWLWVLKVDNDTILLNDATNVISVDSQKLIKDIVPYISVPATYSALSDARLIDEKLRNAMIACGIMEAE